MNAVNVVDPNIGKALQGSVLSAGANQNEKSSGHTQSSAVDSVVLASRAGPRKILSTYETVKFSELVPKALPAKKLEEADRLSGKLTGDDVLSVKEEDSLREDRVLAAIVGMRLIQKGQGEVDKRWIGGLNPPSDAELEAAYRRLTQRVSSPAEVEDPENIHNMRIELLDTYREYREAAKNNFEADESLLAGAAA